MNAPVKKPIPKIDPAKLAAALAAAKAFKANAPKPAAAPVAAVAPAQQQLLINDTPRERISLGEFDISKCVTNLDKENMTHATFLQRLHQLEESLLNRDPLMKDHLKHIHKTMQEFEEIVPLLTNEEIAKIMAAQQSHTNTTLVQQVVKKSSSAATKAATSKASKLGMSDL